jgi:hypothetical protein
MTNLNVVPEGSPLTYELINQMINAINDLQKGDGGLNQIIDVYGARIGTKEDDKVLIFAGEFDLKFSAVSSGQSKSLTARQQVKFPSRNNFTKKPYVAIAIEDPSVGSGNTSFIIATLSDVKRDGFLVRARRLLSPKGTAEADKVKGTYIAIGAGVSKA